jgi:hypothetical protein
MCGAVFETFPSTVARGYGKFCSKECSSKAKIKGEIKCKVDGCNNTTKKGAKGYCGMHYMRVKRYGDVNYITSEKQARINSRNAQPTLGKCKITTYKKCLGRHHHRRVMERKTGRKLNSNEIVHHIDGNVHNNDIENLELMTRAEHASIHFSNRDQSYHSKPVECTYPDGSVITFKSGSEASRQTGVHTTNVSACCHGKTKQCKGFKFKFI